MNKLNQRGFSAVEAILILVIVGALGFIGWRVYDMQADKSNDSSQASDNDRPLDSVDDLDSEADELNSQDIDQELETSDLDASLSE
jgi:hypothetical protein